VVEWESMVGRDGTESWREERDLSGVGVVITVTPPSHSAVLCRLSPLLEEHEPPREEHATLRVLFPRVPLAVPHQLGELAEGRGTENSRGRGLWPRLSRRPAFLPLQVQHWNEQIRNGTFAGKI
jgi:hypothetical protein